MNIKRNKEIFFFSSLIISRKFYSAIFHDFIERRSFLGEKWISVIKKKKALSSTVRDYFRFIWSIMLLSYRVLKILYVNHLQKWHLSALI